MTSWQNNTWVHPSQSKTVFVFVHGILSNSDGCWRNKKTGAYWPSLVAEDRNFEGASVFVSGYTASVGAGIYDARDAADEVLTRLKSTALDPPPLSKDRLLFVCHSQGGIVVREMLRSFPTKFTGKKVGLVLCGSPSWGSLWAKYLAPAVFLIRFRQASALKWGAGSLVDLDRAFLELLHTRTLDISGMCLIETRGPLRLPKIVSEASATRYFPWKRIPRSTHGDIVKPNKPDHLSHEHLRQFAEEHGFLTQKQFKKACMAIQYSMATLNEVYAQPAAPQRRAAAISELRKTANEALNLADKDYGRVQRQLSKMLEAPLDASGRWAFSNFSREDFDSLRKELAALVNQP
ncbi:MAG TPA: alpha/beta hydrolase, partial [Burkholderiales bacterium]|nr:alpha/beta hydrolase [Burkholderiales bacterium]